MTKSVPSYPVFKSDGAIRSRLTGSLMGSIVILLVCLALGVFHDTAFAQVSSLPTTSVSFKGTALVDALSILSKQTGVTIAYESEIVSTITTFCIEENKSVEVILSCLLSGTGLDFFRLSSGAYVLARSAKQSPLYGYLNGAVFDRLTGAPLSNANVYLAKHQIGTATNGSGRFVLPALLPGDYTVAISHVSYEPWQGILTVDPGAVQTATIRLNASTVYVGPIIVDDSDPTAWMEAARSQQTQSAGEVSLNSTGDPFKNLNELSGVRVNDVTADVRIDGTGQGELFMLLDGVPVFLPRSSVGLIGPFSSLAIDHFTVHRVGFGVRPGSFVSGVIDARHGASSDGLSHFQVDPSGVNARVKFGNGISRLSGFVAGRVGLWQVFAPARLAETLSAWSAADPFLLVAPSRRYDLATNAFITDSLSLQVNTKPAIRYSDFHLSTRYRISPIRSIDGSLYVGRNNLRGNRTSSSVEYQIADGSSVADLSIGDNYDWANETGQLQYSTFIGNRTLVQTQGKVSLYRLRHAYELIEDLYLPGPAAELIPRQSNVAADVSDLNNVRFASFSTSVDHARRHHDMGAGVDASYYDTKLHLRSFATKEPNDIASAFPAVVSLESAEVKLSSDLAVLSAFVEDRWEPNEAMNITTGVRATALPEIGRVYFEPKISIRVRGRSRAGSWGAQTSAGLYRQFLVQSDVSKLNAGGLLPTVRVWIPVDKTIRPPISYHIVQSFSLKPLKGLTILAEGFSRFLVSGRQVDYSRLTTALTETFVDLSAGDILSEVEGRTIGTSIKASFDASLIAASVRYGYTDAYLRGESLFSGKRFATPGVDPHELELQLSMRPAHYIVTRLAWRRVSGRSHGFTSAYYDYFGNSDELRLHGSFDFGDPDAHVLPPHEQLDASIALSRQVGRIGLQVRADILNVLDRSNVAEWKVLYENGKLVKSPRPLYPRLSTFSFRMSW